jgi:hypothetical protein
VARRQRGGARAREPARAPGWLRDALLALPAGALHVASWAALALELTFLPLAVLPRLRRWLWAAMLGMHLTLIALVAFADLSFGMVVFHLFVADPAWWREPGLASSLLLRSLAANSAEYIVEEIATMIALSRFRPAADSSPSRCSSCRPCRLDAGAARL